MRTAVKTTATAAAVLWLLCCCCCPARGATELHHENLQGKSNSAADQLQRTKDLMAATSVTATASAQDAIDVPLQEVTDGGTGNNNGTLRNYLLRKPSKIFQKLMSTGVDVVQRGLDAYQGVSSKVFKVARKTIGRSRDASGTVTAGPDETVGGAAVAAGNPSGEAVAAVGSATPRSVKAAKPAGGLVHSVVNLMDSGITGMEEANDFGLLLGNMGTHKIKAKLDGRSGNKEVFNLLIKYVGSKVGAGSKNRGVQMLDDVGTISTFVAHNDDVSMLISTLMERFMDDPEVSKATVRLVINTLDGNPSTKCVLDKLPLAPSDVRMLFDVFVGSNGQMMMKTIAGLLSEITTGPDTRAFLESAMGMVSMFSGSTPAGTEKSEKSSGLFGSFAGLFTGSDNDVDENASLENKIKETKIKTESSPPPVEVKRKKRTTPKRLAKQEEDPWFSSAGDDAKTTSKRAMKKAIQSSEEDDMFSKTSARSIGNGVVKPKSASQKSSAKLNKDSWDGGSKKATITSGGSKARNINISDDDGDVYSVKSKRKTTTSVKKKTKTSRKNDSDNNSSNYSDSGEKLPSKKQKSKDFNNNRA